MIYEVLTIVIGAAVVGFCHGIVLLLGSNILPLKKHVRIFKYV